MYSLTFSTSREQSADDYDSSAASRPFRPTSPLGDRNALSRAFPFARSTSKQSSQSAKSPSKIPWESTSTPSPLSPSPPPPPRHARAQSPTGSSITYDSDLSSLSSRRRHQRDRSGSTGGYSLLFANGMHNLHLKQSDSLVVDEESDLEGEPPLYVPASTHPAEKGAARKGLKQLVQKKGSNFSLRGLMGRGASHGGGGGSKPMVTTTALGGRSPPRSPQSLLAPTGSRRPSVPTLHRSPRQELTDAPAFLTPLATPTLPLPTPSLRDRTTSHPGWMGEEGTKGSVKGKAAKILGEEVVPKGKAARLLGVERKKTLAKKPSTTSLVDPVAAPASPTSSARTSPSPGAFPFTRTPLASPSPTLQGALSDTFPSSPFNDIAKRARRRSASDSFARLIPSSLAPTPSPPASEEGDVHLWGLPESASIPLSSTPPSASADEPVLDLDSFPEESDPIDSVYAGSIRHMRSRSSTFSVGVDLRARSTFSSSSFAPVDGGSSLTRNPQRLSPESFRFSRLVAGAGAGPNIDFFTSSADSSPVESRTSSSPAASRSPSAFASKRPSVVPTQRTSSSSSSSSSHRRPLSQPPLPPRFARSPSLTSPSLSRSSSFASLAAPPPIPPAIPLPPIPTTTALTATAAGRKRSSTIGSVASSGTRRFQRLHALDALEGRRGAFEEAPEDAVGRGSRKRAAMVRKLNKLTEEGARRAAAGQEAGVANKENQEHAERRRAQVRESRSFLNLDWSDESDADVEDEGEGEGEVAVRGMSGRRQRNGSPCPPPERPLPPTPPSITSPKTGEGGNDDGRPSQLDETSSRRTSGASSAATSLTNTLSSTSIPPALSKEVPLPLLASSPALLRSVDPSASFHTTSPSSGPYTSSASIPFPSTSRDDTKTTCTSLNSSPSHFKSTSISSISSLSSVSTSSLYSTFSSDVTAEAFPQPPTFAPFPSADAYSTESYRFPRGAPTPLVGHSRSDSDSVVGTSLAVPKLKDELQRAPSAGRGELAGSFRVAGTT
ncbi:hypothetical protein JCM1840_004906 [Sporobolomyces johnsonii]